MSRYFQITGSQVSEIHWQRMTAVRDSCSALGISCPPEVEEFFRQHENICDEEGELIKVDLTDPRRGGVPWVTRLPESSTYEINVKALPDSVKFLYVGYD